MRRDVGLCVDEVHLHLQRRIAEEPQELGLGHILDRHEVQNEDAQRTDILTIRACRIHDEDVLPLEHVRRRQIVRYLNRHCFPFPFPMKARSCSAFPKSTHLIAVDPCTVAVCKGAQANETAPLGRLAHNHAVSALIAIVQRLPAI